MTRRRLVVPVLAAALLAAPTVATGATIPFGADLAAQPANDNAAATCAAGPPELFGKPAGSCMWSFIGLGAAPSLEPPAAGTVTAVRVKVGAVTGRMRVNVIRFLFQQTGDVAHPASAGPFLEVYGPEFTPTPNSITTVPVSLPMKIDPTPNPNDLTTIAVYDVLALEVEEANVPIPLYASPGSLSYYSYPGPTAAGIPAPSPNGVGAATSGYGVLMNADLDTGGAAGGGGGAPAGGGGAGAPAPAPGAPAGGGAPAVTPGLPAAVPVAALPQTALRVREGAVKLPVRCEGADCAGTVTLLAPRTARADAAAKSPLTYGRAPFRALAGQTAQVRIKLTRAGRKLLERHRRAKVLAQVTMTGRPTATRTITLRR